MCLFLDLNAPDPVLESINYPVTFKLNYTCFKILPIPCYKLIVLLLDTRCFLSYFPFT